MAKIRYGLSDTDLASIEPSYIQEHPESTYANPKYIIRYNVWDILQLKASTKCGIPFDRLISKTQALKNLKVKCPMLVRLINIAHTLIHNANIGDVWSVKPTGCCDYRTQPSLRQCG
jgi:hypothetical protein